MNYLSTLNPKNTPTSINAEDNLLVIRERILHLIFIALSILGIFLYPIILVTSIHQNSWQLSILYSFMYIFILLFTFFRRTAYNLRVSFLAFNFYLSGIIILIRGGLSGYSSVFMITFAILLTIMIGTRAGIGSTILAVVTTITIGWLITSAKMPTPASNLFSNSNNILDWLIFSGILILVTVFFISLLRLLMQGLEQTIQEQLNLTAELRRERIQLDDRIHQRTRELQKRASQLEVAGLVARDISTSTNLDELLNSSVQLIKDRFNFYHAGIFLLDERKEYAVLRAATGEAGRRMIESNHKLRTGATGIVGYVVGKGEAHIALDVNVDEVHFKNPLLSQTRSEMALPLKVGKEIIGALDVQSVEENAFVYEDVQTLQTIADQLAVAIDKASLMEKLQGTIQELEASNNRDISKSWRSFLKSTKRAYAYRLRHSTLETDITSTKEADDALQQGHSIVTLLDEETTPNTATTAVAVPIKLRNQVLGVIDLRFANISVSDDLISLLEVTANRLGLALENARLLEELQIRAGREHMVSEVSTKLRTSTDIDSILRAAAVELGKALNTSEVLVQLRPVDEGEL